MTKSTKSVKLMIMLMRSMGLWYTSGKSEKFLANLMLNLVLTLMIFSFYVQSQELYYSRNSLTLIAFAAPSATVVLTEISKLIVFAYKRKQMTKLNKFVDAEFWKKSYTGEEQRILNNCDIFCFKSVRLCVSFVLSTCSQYVVSSLLGMIVNGTSGREFPFPMRFHKWLYGSPLFEMYFALELVATLATGLCVSTFTSYSFTMNLFTAAHFEVLSMNLKSLCDFDETCKTNKNIRFQREALCKLKKYITRHQMLIGLTKEIEDLYCYVILQQAFGSVLQICFLGVQVLLVETTFDRLFLEILFMLSSLLQFYFYCYSAQEVFEASQNVSQAIYFTKWLKITHPKISREFRQLMRIVILRAQRSCILTVGKFYPLNLATYTSVIGTSMSYFTVLRQLIE